MVREKAPVSRKALIADSPLSERATVDALNELFHASEIYQDSSSAYSPVTAPRMDRHDALKELAMMHFRDFGIFTADMLSRFIGAKMSVTRRILRELEDDRFIVKGFLMKDDPTLMWMLASDADSHMETVRNDMILLNNQDNLHVYLRDYIRREAEATDSVILKGTKIIASFKGKVTASGAKVEDFTGSPEAKRFLKNTAASMGVSIEDNRRADEDKDWDVSEFYLKANPGVL